MGLREDRRMLKSSVYGRQDNCSIREAELDEGMLTTAGCCYSILQGIYASWREKSHGLDSGCSEAKKPVCSER